ncbi:MAG TPA: nucleotide sugar dehydrogenase [Nocardioidaceae bacterium]|nr:nucleotide sugar dehydrogenase [Nocardioidaceae bacterium]
MTAAADSAVGVIGVGYVGLVTAACFADLGHNVVCRDINPQRVADLRAGKVPIYEPGVDRLLDRNRERLTFTEDMADVFARCRVVFVCVDTPPMHSGDADLSRVNRVIDELPETTERFVLVMKSTVPVGTGDKVRTELEARGLEHVGYVSNPEFLREGRAVADFMEPDRIVIGAFAEEDGDAVEALYADLDATVVRTDTASAEMIKYASNAFLATKISFINEIANVCEEVGADVAVVAHAMGLDERIGTHFLRPGIGYGGSCLAGSEYVTVRFRDAVEEITLEELHRRLGGGGLIHPQGLEALAWRVGDDSPEFLPVEKMTARAYDGEAVRVFVDEVTGVTATADHPFVVLDGEPSVRPASELGVGTLVPRLLSDGPPPINPLPGITGATPMAPQPAVLRVAWEPVSRLESRTLNATVYSLELPEAGTFVTTGGVIVHNCFPKDVQALKQLAGNSGYHFQLLTSVIEVNELQKRRLVGKLERHLGPLRGRRIAMLGLAFKANTDDMREASSLVLSARLLAEGARVVAYDPVAMETAGSLLGDKVELAGSMMEAVTGADAAVIVTEWGEFRSVASPSVLQAMATPLIVDGRNLLDPDQARAAGFLYESVGRPSLGLV